MPYSPDNIPDRIKGLPEAAQKIWIAAFNAAIEEYKGDEQKANATAWSAVEKAGYKKEDDKWVKASELEKMFYLNELDFKKLALSEKNKMSDIQLLRVGTWEHPMHGKFTINESDLDKFVENFDTNIRRIELAVDAEHFPEKGAAGWIKNVYKKGTDLLGSVEWTEWGLEAIKKKLFKYVSAEFDFKYKDAETGEKFSNVLFGAALTNRPFIKDQIPVALSENVKEENFYHFTKEPKQKKGDKKMEIKDFVVKLNEGFGLKLSETATIEEISGTIAKLNEKVIASEKMKGELVDMTAKLAEATKGKEGQVTLAEHTKLKTDFEELQKKIKLNEANELVSKAMSEGKILPKQKDWATTYALSDRTGFETFIKDAAVVVKLNENGSGNVDGGCKENEVKLNESVMKLREKNSKLSYGQALKITLNEHPELEKELSKE